MDNKYQTNTNATFGTRIIGTKQENIGSGTEWLIFAVVIILYAVDIYLLWFDGIDFVKSLNNIYNILLKGLFINAIFWVVLVFVYIWQRPQNKEEFISDLVVVAGYFLVISLTGLNNGMCMSNVPTAIHLLVIFFIRKTILLKKFDAAQANYYTILILFLDFFSFNLIHSFFPQVSSELITRVIFPVLPLFVLMFMDESRGRNIILFLVLVFYIFLFMRTYNVTSQFQMTMGEYQTLAAKEEAKGALQRIKDFGLGIFKSYNESKQIIAGNYYTGQVEQYENVPLGVFLEDIEASDNYFTVGETVTVWATLKAYTIEDNTININVKCYAKDLSTNKAIEGEITPKKDFKVESYDEEFITCTFKGENSISEKEGYYPIVFNATFDFSTQAYLKTYYIEKERKRVLQSEDIDIFSEYGITDRNPSAKFTNGPLQIGMGTTTPPIGVGNSNKEFSSFLGISINNNWKGNIKKIKSLFVDLPDGLVFNDDCDFFLGMDGNDDFKYKLKDDEINKDNEKSFKLPKSYKCSLQLYNQAELLGTTPISIKYFKTQFDYTYLITEKTSVTVKKKND